jgi:DNA-binding PadR family transcriptional regulator
MTRHNDYLGGLEEVVLLVVQQLDDNAYGATIFETMREANRKLSIGSLYVTLGRLEDKGFLSSRQGEPTPERGGRAKKYFKLTGTGVTALHEAEAMRRQFRGDPGYAGGVA